MKIPAVVAEMKPVTKSTVYRKIKLLEKAKLWRELKMKLVDKPLTERQKTFANLYVLHAGSVSRTKIAIEAGYPERSAYQRAHELLNEEICPHGY